MEKILLNCYKDFKCIANKCPKTCCENWEIEVDEKTLENYKMINSEYSKKILANLYYSNGNIILQKLKDVNDLHSKNAQPPMLFTLSGIVMLVKLYFSKNTGPLILVTPSGIAICVSFPR